MGRNSYGAAEVYESIPLLEANLYAQIQQGSLDDALYTFDRLLRRRRTPAAPICSGLLELTCMQARLSPNPNHNPN